MGEIMEKLRREFFGKKILVVGLGLQGGGVGVARFFAKLGARVKVTDKKTTEELKLSIDELKGYSIEYRLGEHKLGDFLEADLIFKGPSVVWDMSEIVAAQKKGIPVEMELSFVVANSPTKKIIGITGTRGKSTTTQMIYEVLKEYCSRQKVLDSVNHRSNNKTRVFLGGNIPNTSTISYLESITKDDFLVLEIPSWPLSAYHRKKISPHIAVFTNFYPDHLNYYQSMEDYLWDKKAIYLYQKPEDHLIINKRFKEIIQNDLVQSSVHFYSDKGYPDTLIHLRGVHNKENAAACYEVAKILGLDLIRASKVIAQFIGLPYRQQKIAEKDGVIFINDTTSTTPVAAEKAIETFGQSPIVMILGGNSKGLPYDDLMNALGSASKIVLLKGSFTEEIYKKLSGKYPNKITEVYSDMNEAVKRAYEEAKLLREGNDQVFVVLSPAATSFASFKNEFDRGDKFNKAVKIMLS